MSVGLYYLRRGLMKYTEVDLVSVFAYYNSSHVNIIILYQD